MSDFEKQYKDTKSTEQGFPSIIIHVKAFFLGVKIFNEIKQKLKIPLRREKITFNECLVLMTINNLNSSSSNS